MAFEMRARAVSAPVVSARAKLGHDIVAQRPAGSAQGDRRSDIVVGKRRRNPKAGAADGRAVEIGVVSAGRKAKGHRNAQYPSLFHV